MPPSSHGTRQQTPQCSISPAMMNNPRHWPKRKVPKNHWQLWHGYWHTFRHQTAKESWWSWRGWGLGRYWWVSFFCWRSDKTLKIIILWNRRTYVTSTTMLRRHLEREHKVGYLNSLLLILIPNADRQHTINGVGKMILQRNCPTLSNRPRKLQTSIEICYNRAILTAIFIKYHSRSELYLIQTNYSARLRLNGW